MKKIFLVVTLVGFTLLSSPASAQTSDKFSTYFGFYTGYNKTNDDVSDADGVDFGGFAGLKVNTLFTISNNIPISAAFEIHYGLSTAEDTISNGRFAGIKLEKEQEIGFSFRPGFYAYTDETFSLNPYAIIGYRQAEYEASAGGSQIDGTYNGLELGFGAELVAYENWLMRAEYSHVFYTDDGGAFEPSEDTVRLGIAYKF